MEDSKIIELFFSRSEQALSEIKTKYDRLCMKIAGSILCRNEDAEECVSTSYFKLWNAIPPKNPTSLRGYLCKIVRNTALDYERSDKNGRYEELSEIIPAGNNVEKEYDAERITEYINDFLKNTERKSRGIFVMRYYFGLSVKETAENAGMSENAVVLRLSRMRTGLKRYLEERGVEI